MAAGTREIYDRITAFINVNDLLIDTRLLLIHKKKKISEGNSSTVYEGSYDVNRVAVKELEPSLGSPVSRELVLKFEREVLRLHHWGHANIVTLIGASAEPRLLIVMELMQGGSLKSYLWNMRPHPPALQQSIRFALDICPAMVHLHANNIIHRDLKPGNLLLDAGHNILKVADFGISQVGADNRQMIYETGSRPWMAPEMTKAGATGELVYDNKVDVYSFGVVLWQLLTNRTPPKTNRPSVAELPNRVPQDLVHLLETCLAETPAARPEFTAITVQLTDILDALV